MRIDKLDLRNFRCYEDTSFDWHPKFNLIVGKNATGKTALLDGLAVAMGSWLLGVRGYDSRHIRDADIRNVAVDTPAGYVFQPKELVSVAAEGVVGGKSIKWKRELRRGGRTTIVDAKSIRTLAEKAATGKGPNTLPVISYYGTGRLWLEPKQTQKVSSPTSITSKSKLNPLEAYRNSVDPRLSSRQLVEWVARQAWIAYQQGKSQSVFDVVLEAIKQSIEGGRHLYFDPSYGEVILEVEGSGRHPFSQLSDGQRCMLALIGDIAQKAVRLNSHLGDEVLKLTPGIVLIDELEMHLHPTWQQSVADSLKFVFPNIQFFCTTHSPQIIRQTPKDEIRILNGDGTYRIPSFSFGLSSDEVLETVQGALSRDDLISRLETEFHELLDEFDIEAAEAKLAAAALKLGRPHPVLSRWETELENANALAESSLEIEEGQD